MANSLRTTDWLANKSLYDLINKLSVAMHFNTDYNKEFDKPFAVGATVRVKYPQRWRITESMTFDPQPIDNQETTVTIDKIANVHFEWTDIEAVLSLDRQAELQKRIIDPAVKRIRQKIDSDAALWAAQNTPNIVGVLGTDPTTFDAVSGAARQRLTEMACTGGNEAMIISPSVNRALRAASVSYFNPQTDQSKLWRTGQVGTGDDFDWYTSMSLASHTAGVWQTPNDVTVSGAGQSGNSILLNCTSGDTFNKGDVIGLTGYYPVNPGTQQAAQQSSMFTVTVAADTVASASTVTVPLVADGPGGAIVGPTSPYQNITDLPADLTLCVLFPGTTNPSTGPKAGKQGLAFSDEAFALVGVALEQPKASSVEISSLARDPKTGLSIRVTRAWDPVQSRMINRFDCIYGFGNLYPRNCAVRVLGAA